MDRKPERLTKQQRQERIVAELRISPAIRASEIAAKLGVHAETVRRDLRYLDRNGLLSRTYGGAAIAPLAFERAWRNVTEFWFPNDAVSANALPV